MKIMASGPITSWQIDGEMWKLSDFIFLGCKINADCDCSHEIKRHLLLGRIARSNLDSVLKSREINESERIKEKRIKRNEDNLRDLQDNVKRYNIRIIGVQEEEDKKKDHEKILEEIIVENFPKMRKEIITQVQETQRVPNRINPRQNTPRPY